MFWAFVIIGALWAICEWAVWLRNTVRAERDDRRLVAAIERLEADR